MAAAGDVALGSAFGYADHIGIPDGLFFSVVTATTVGYGDITPHGWLPHLISVVIMLTIIPLFAATFSLFTSGLTEGHVRRAERRIKQHAEEIAGERRP